MPIVRYSCMNCIDNRDRTPLLAVVEVSEGKCTCGCADSNEETACATNKQCCCGEEETGTEGGQNGNETEQGTDGSCSNVRIEKLNLPTLTSSVHLDDGMFPVIELLFYHFIINTDLLSSGHEREFYADISMHKMRPRGYLNLICTWVI